MEVSVSRSGTRMPMKSADRIPLPSSLHANHFFMYLGKDTECRKMRTAIGSLCVRSVLHTYRHIIRWVATNEMLADRLTKLGVKGDRLLEVLANGRFRLISEGVVMKRRSDQKYVASR